ncbi:MAG: hypothetical protein V3U86_06745, partial [Acidobacteriota bacterium]
MKRKRSYTIMIVPHATAEFKKYTISSKALMGTALLAVCLGLCGVLLPYYLVRTFQYSNRVERLEQENTGLREANTRFDESLAELSDYVTEFENKS